MSGNLDFADMDAVKRIGCYVLQKPVTINIIEEVKPRLSPDGKSSDLNGRLAAIQ